MVQGPDVGVDEEDIARRERLERTSIYSLQIICDCSDYMADIYWDHRTSHRGVVFLSPRCLIVLDLHCMASGVCGHTRRVAVFLSSRRHSVQRIHDMDVGSEHNSKRDGEVGLLRAINSTS